MYDEKLFEQVENFLQRNLSPEERRFLILAREMPKPQDKPLYKVTTASGKVA